MPDSLERVCLSGDYQAFVRQQLDNPYALYDRLRKLDPIHWCKPMRCWLLTRYSDVFALLNDSRLSTNRGGLYLDLLTPENRLLARPLVNHINTWMLTMDEPRHTRCRRLVSLAFTPRMITGLRPMIERVVGELIDHLSKQGPVDFMREFAEKLPAYVISDMLGIPRADRDHFQEWAVSLTRFSAAAGPELNDFVVPASTGLQKLIELFDPLISERRLKPQEDLISSMLLVEEDGDQLSWEELFAMCIFLFIAGQDTTMALLGSSVWLLSQDAEQLAELRAQPAGLVEMAVEEFVRCESPVPRGVRRARKTFQIDGRQIEQDQTVILLIGAANRDPAQFPDPHRLDIKRTPNQHVGFGRGPHFCIGAPLARLEAQIALREIARRVSTLQPLTDHPQWTTNMGLRSLVELPLEIDVA